jgi:glycosyltransferase involved in cell wall biosynthesis
VKISILIPTCNRPQFLRECIESAIRQTLPADEILIGDDSSDDSSQEVVRQIAAKCRSIKISYFRHCPALGQSGNVSHLMKVSKGTHLTLIHDDDWLLDEALEKLSKAFDVPDVIVSYGRQILASDSGVLNYDSIESINSSFWRSSADAGLQNDIRECALCGQFPNNGWLVERNAALKIEYQDIKNEFGTGSDFRFSALFSEANPRGKAFLVDANTAVYRASIKSIARTKNCSTAAMHAFPYVLSKYPEFNSHRVAYWLSWNAPVAVGQAIKNKSLKKAWRWFFTKWHLKSIFTLGAVKRTILLGGLIVKVLGDAVMSRIPASKYNR